MAVLRTAEDFADLATAYLDRARADGVTRVEMFFDPQMHLSRGVPLTEVIGGLRAAADRSAAQGGPHAGLIACFLRDLGPADAAVTLEALAGHAGELLGVGLDSAEVGYPPADFAGVFADARALGLHTVAHAGEEGPPEYVWQALDVLGVERVDHGIRSVEDPALLRRLAADRTPLTVCPLSNVRLRCVEGIASHPIPRLLEAGVHVTVNSDDPAYFGGYVADNYLALAEGLGLGHDTLAALAASSLAACLDRPLAGEEAGHVRGLGGKRRPGPRVERGERREGNPPARERPGRHGPAADQRERPEQPVVRDDVQVRADDGLPGGPAEQQRVESAEQPGRR
jgi:adenosine deaminase